MKWVLDTNAIYETIRRPPNANVISWIERQPIDEVTISIVTLAEIQDGIGSAPEHRHSELVSWLDAVVMPTFGERALQLTTNVLIEWSRLSRKLAAERMMRSAADLLIAATARVHELTIVTRNVRHFANTGVLVYDPWNDKTHVMDGS